MIVAGINNILLGNVIVYSILLTHIQAKVRYFPPVLAERLRTYGQTFRAMRQIVACGWLHSGLDPPA